jgi:hypothetical protein
VLSGFRLVTVKEANQIVPPELRQSALKLGLCAYATELLLVDISCAAAMEDRTITADIASAPRDDVVLTIAVVFCFSSCESFMPIIANLQSYCSFLSIYRTTFSLIRNNF